MCRSFGFVLKRPTGRSAVLSCFLRCLYQVLKDLHHLKLALDVPRLLFSCACRVLRRKHVPCKKKKKIYIYVNTHTHIYI